MGQFTQVKMFLINFHSLEKDLETIINVFLKGQVWILKGGIKSIPPTCLLISSWVEDNFHKSRSWLHGQFWVYWSIICSRTRAYEFIYIIIIIFLIFFIHFFLVKANMYQEAMCFPIVHGIFLINKS